MELKECCMGIAKLLFLFLPLLLSWPQNSRETPCCNIQTGNECEQGTHLNSYRYFKKLFLDCTDNLESCCYPITIHCCACFEYRLLRLLREENSLVNSQLWAEKDMRKTTLSQEANGPFTPTSVSPSLDLSGLPNHSFSRLVRLFTGSCLELLFWVGVRDRRANLAQMNFQTKKPALLIKLLYNILLLRTYLKYFMCVFFVLFCV